MAQVTLYMDDDTMARMRAAAEAAGLSMSAWLAQLVQERTRTEWPREVAALAGAWRDLAGAEQLREAQPEDAVRETL
ncbi:MAG: CopG family transcriptional regulator [Deltaproteobacteria bacterium]|nr:MAG: CopG family transcriptional regulator [Deltaproteobacteria bacterium]